MITSVSNAKIKNVMQLNQKAKARREQGLFVAEGRKMFLEAPREQLQEVYVSESFLEKCSCREHLEEVGYEVVCLRELFPGWRADGTGGEISVRDRKGFRIPSDV